MCSHEQLHTINSPAAPGSLTQKGWFHLLNDAGKALPRDDSKSCILHLEKMKLKKKTIKMINRRLLSLEAVQILAFHLRAVWPLNKNHSPFLVSVPPSVNDTHLVGFLSTLENALHSSLHKASTWKLSASPQGLSDHLHHLWRGRGTREGSGRTEGRWCGWRQGVDGSGWHGAVLGSPQTELWVGICLKGWAASHCPHITLTQTCFCSIQHLFFEC